MRRLIANTTFVLLGALVAGCPNKQLGDPDWVEREVTWGEPADGLQAGLARREYKPGKTPGPREALYGLRLRNVSRRPIRVLSPIKPRFGEPVLPPAGDESVAITFEYEGSGGTKTRRFSAANRPLVYTIEPGDERTTEVRLDARDFGHDELAPGRLRGVYENAQRQIDYAGAGNAPVTGIWTGRATSGWIEIEGGAVEQTKSQ